MQKGSLYLADANYLWHMSFQMGLKFTDVEEQYEHYVPNSTKCSRWSDVKRSHLEKERPATAHQRIRGLRYIYSLGEITRNPYSQAV